MSGPLSVVIVGGGFSGVTAAANLLRSGAGPVRITIVEPSERIGEGPAYSTDDPAHLLNVPAKKMGAWADAPDHFWKWIHARGLGHDPDAFMPRMLYAEYLRDVLVAASGAACAGSTLQIVHDRVSEVACLPGGVRVGLESGGELEADALVLAIGLGPPRRPGGGVCCATDRRVIGPWVRGWADAIAPDERVLIVGTGLTMLDVLLTLERRGHRGGVDAVSVTGLLPLAHAPSATGVGIGVPPVGAGPVAQLKWIRAEVRAGAPWRSVIDSMRPHTPAIWRGFSVRDRSRFLRRLAPYWDVHRHRCAPGVRAAVDAMIARGDVRLHAARVAALAVDGGVVRAELASGGSRRTIEADRVVLCTGPEPDPCAWSPLIAGLVSQGALTPDELSIGLACDADGCALDRSGRRTRVWLLGALRRGELWETTAVPELRVQTASLASSLLDAELRRPGPPIRGG